jgi:hypothetical protein
MNRRAFLRASLGGSAILVAGGAGLVLWPTELAHKPTRALAVVDDRQFAVLAAVAARTCTAPNADPVEIAHRVDGLMGLQCVEARADFKKLLNLFDNALAGLLFDGRPKPFTRLTPVAQDEALVAWRESRVADRRRGYQVLRKLTQAAWYGPPSGWASTGYPGPPSIIAAAQAKLVQP